MKKIKKNSLVNKFVIPMTLLLIVEMSAILFIICFGKTFKTLDSQALDTFQGKVELRGTYLETSMIDSWGDLENDSLAIKDDTKSFLSKNALNINEVLSSNEKSIELLKVITPNIRTILSKNKVTDAFIILNNSNVTGTNKNILYLRTPSPNYISSDNGNVVVEAAPFEIADDLSSKNYDSSLSYDTRFNYNQLNEVSKNTFDFPIDQSILHENETLDESAFAYWNNSFLYHDSEVITYSIPIRFENQTIGLLGVGISYKYIKSLFSVFTNNGDELKNVCIYKKKSDGTIEKALASFLDNNLSFDLTNIISKQKNDIFSFKQNGKVYYLYEQELNLYSKTVSPYDETWYISGIDLKTNIVGANNQALSEIVVTIIIVLIISIIGEIFVSLLISRPVVRVSRDIERSSINNIPNAGIYEIDNLIEKLKLYFNKNEQSGNTLNRILELSGTQIAAFEYEFESKLVSVTDLFYKMLNLDYSNDDVSLDEFKKRLLFISKNYSDTDKNVYTILLNNHWLNLKIVYSNSSVIGVLTDITREKREKEKIERERDYDILTNLLNRRGFYSEINKIWNSSLNEGYLMMIDLDNLKHINDNYGHEAGDEYIRSTGKFIEEYEITHKNTIACHLSGDEFLVFVHNLTNEEIENYVEDFKEVLKVSVEFYGDKYQVSLSCGIAPYKKEYNEFDDLRKCADFAMYEVKQTNKNGFNYFNMERYLQSQNRLDLRSEFNDIIEHEKIKYVFQPIVDVKDGEILGYEALMRPMGEHFASPLDFINFARSEGKLGDIENITFKLATILFAKSNSKKYLFINSLSSQQVSQDIQEYMLAKYSDLVRRVVIEITEEESLDVNILKYKLKGFPDQKQLFAIDDYGTGYNNMAMVFDTNANFIKIEGTFIRGIDTNQKKQQFTKSIIEYCKKNGTLVIAESVETLEELKMVKSLGVDYAQGFFISKPLDEVKDIPDEIKKVVKKA